MSYSTTKIRTPVDILRHIQQRLSDEGELSEGAKNILDEYIAKEEKYSGTIVRAKKSWKRLPARSPQYLETLELADKKRREYKQYCEELGPHPTLDQINKKKAIHNEMRQHMLKLFTLK